MTADAIKDLPSPLLKIENSFKIARAIKRVQLKRMFKLSRVV